MRAKQFLVKLTTLPTNRHSIKEILKDELQKEVTIIKEIVMEIGEILKLNGITYQNLCEYIRDAWKKVVMLDAYVRRKAEK